MSKKLVNYDSLKLKNQLCFPIYLCSKEIVRNYNNILKEYDLTYTQYIVMMYLWEKSESNVKDLGSALLLDSSTLTPLLKKLEIKGYIERNRDVFDERNLIIKLTSDGEKLKDKVLSVPEKISKCIKLNNKDAEELYKLIYKTLLNVEKGETNDNN